MKIQRVMFSCLMLILAGTQPPVVTGSPPAASQQGISNGSHVVKARKGPIEISLKVWKTRLAPGESIWYQIRLRNVGQERIEVADDAFAYPGILNDRSLNGGYPLRLEVQNSRRRTPFQKLRGNSRVGSDDLSDQPGPDVSRARREHSQDIARWRREGLDDFEINQKLARIALEAMSPREENVNVIVPERFWLLPGASTATAAFSNDLPQLGATVANTVKPIGDFAELSELEMPPGRYRVRAVWDDGLEGKMARKYAFPKKPSNVTVTTTWIDLTVTP